VKRRETPSKKVPVFSYLCSQTTNWLFPTVNIDLPQGKRIYFASDFHLGVPDFASSRKRELLLVKWLESVRHDAHSIYLLGDTFDFWFEYKHVIPRGFTRFLGKLAELRDAGIPIIMFIGNHDMWMFDYFPKELDIPIIRQPQVLEVGNQRLLIGHGDGLGPGDFFYKILRAGLFHNRFCQWLFNWIHPNLGMAVAHAWSRSSRISNLKKEKFMEERNEFLLAWCTEMEKKEHHDYYIFGHRHLPLDLQVGTSSRYINLGEWVNFSPYAFYDGRNVKLTSFEITK
jgi:UDP-2,3-diacylglucosamine hydrolase